MATVPILWDPIPVSVTLVGLEQTVVKVIFLNNHSQIENHKLYKKHNYSAYKKIENSQTFMNNLSKNNMRRCMYFFYRRQKVIVLRCYQFYVQILTSVSKHHVSIMVPV